MIKKIILLLISMLLLSCRESDDINKFDNSNNGAIIDTENTVQELGIGKSGDTSTIEVNGGFIN